MINNIKFGECLKSMLYTLDISMSRLAKAINVDSSLVNRWIHGQRIPLYNTSYIENIAEYLSKNVQNEFQMHRLKEIFIQLLDSNCSDHTIKENISSALSYSQGYTIESKRKELSLLKSNDNCKRAVLSHVALSSEDKIILGNNNVWASGTDLLETASKTIPKNNKTIYISVSSFWDITALNRPDLLYLRKCMQKSMENGWNVILFVRLSSNIHSLVKVIEFTKPLIKSGKFIAYYLKKYDIFTIGQECLCIPGVGTLSCYSASLDSAIDYGFYLKNTAAVNIICDNFKYLLKTCAQPIFNYYSQENIHKYALLIRKNEESIGGRFLFNDSISILSLPQSLYARLLKKAEISQDEIKTALEYHNSCRKSFLENLKMYPHRDIYLAGSLNYLIKNRQFYLYCLTQVKLVELDKEDLIELLQNIIYLLKTYRNYNIGFIPGDSFAPCKCYCMVKERHSAFIEAYEQYPNMPSARLSVNEPMLVKALEEYFAEMWDSISPVNKDKKEILRWIENWLFALKTAEMP